MKRISILLLTVAFVAVVVHSQTVNFSSVKVKTKTELSVGLGWTFGRKSKNQ